MNPAVTAIHFSSLVALNWTPVALSVQLQVSVLIFVVNAKPNVIKVEIVAALNSNLQVQK